MYARVSSAVWLVSDFSLNPDEDWPLYFDFLLVGLGRRRWLLSQTCSNPSVSTRFKISAGFSFLELLLPSNDFLQTFNAVYFPHISWLLRFSKLLFCRIWLAWCINVEQGNEKVYFNLTISYIWLEMGYQFRNKQIAIAITVVAAMALILGVVALNSIVLQNVGNVKTINVEVYWDSNCTNEVSLINWGIIEPGTTENVTVYILNTGNSNIMLSMNTTNWSPSSAPDYITLSWDYEDQSVGPSQVLQTTLTLSMSPSIQGITSFAFDLVIVGSG